MSFDKLENSWIDPLKESSMSDQKVTLYYTNSKIVSDQKNRGFYITDDYNEFGSVNPTLIKLLKALE